LGTPAITTRGLKTEHMAQIAEWMKLAIENRGDDKLMIQIKKEVFNLVNNIK